MGPSKLLEHVVAVFERLGIPYLVTAENFEADFAAPEDVIIKKMEYYREGGSEKHLRDITGILMTTGDDVDRLYIERWAQQLGLGDIWEAIEKRLRS